MESSFNKPKLNEGNDLDAIIQKLLAAKSYII